MDDLREYKVRYGHEKARGVLKHLGAMFVRKELQEDMYLVSNDRDIYKIARVNGNMRFIHLVREGDNFRRSTDMQLEESAAKELKQLFDTSDAVMRKDREQYKWGKSEIVLDDISNLGQFIEFYPANKEEQKALFANFGIDTSVLITESYYSLSQK